jgi:hypothetical protein
MWVTKVPYDRVREHLRRVAPEHVGGYDDGLLTLKWFEFQGKWCCHVYTREDDGRGDLRIVTTVL